MKRLLSVLLVLCITLCFGAALAETAAPEASPATLTVTGEAQVIIPWMRSSRPSTVSALPRRTS